VSANNIRRGVAMTKIRSRLATFVLGILMSASVLAGPAVVNAGAFGPVPVHLHPMPIPALVLPVRGQLLELAAVPVGAALLVAPVAAPRASRPAPALVKLAGEDPDRRPGLAQAFAGCSEPVHLNGRINHHGRLQARSARRDTGRLANALQRDFAQAQRRLGTPGTSTRPARASAPSHARGARSGTAVRQPRRARSPARAGATAPASARSAAAGRSPSRPAGAARGAILEALAGGQA
jgi:hypothetical protein